MKYAHKEAFALMWYECKCSHRERIWNSRDGVTPFGCLCPSCGDVMRHSDFRADECVPDHQPNHGQRYFRDGTPDEAEAIMKRRIAAMADEYPTTREMEDSLIHQARTGESHEFQRGWPMIDVFDVFRSE